MSDWPQVPFVSLLKEPVRNGIYKPKEFHGRGAKIVNMGELFGHPRLRAVDMKRVELSKSETDRFGLAVGDLIFARRSLTAEGAGKCSVILELEGDTTFESSIIRARPNQKLADSLFLYYFFSSSVGAHQLDTIRRQVAVAGITGSDLSQLLVPAPALSEQLAIASVLGALDDKIELNRRMNETLEAMARAIFKDWFVDFGPTRAKMAMRGEDPQKEGTARAPYLAPDIWSLFPDRLDDEGKPEGWTPVPLSALVEVNPSEALARGAPAPYLDMASIPTAGPNPDPYVTREFGSGMRFRNGDALLARITPCLENGKTAFVQNLPEGDVGWGSTEFIVLRARAPLPRAVSYVIARDPTFRANAIRSMTGTSGRQRASNAAVAAFQLISPAEDGIWQALGSLIDPMFARIAANDRECRTLADTRDLLLPKLMSGEVRVKDAEKLVGEAT